MMRDTGRWESGSGEVRGRRQRRGRRKEEWQDEKQEEVGVEVEELEKGLEEKNLQRTSLGSLLPMAVLSRPSQS